ncbi:hypothetical protein HDU86_008099 [Geranomyces michiganensis]|nr:hypothetical protein HDU86_008099 [Geranomyces michiganensis]
MAFAPAAHQTSRDKLPKLEIGLPTPDTTPPRPRVCASPSSSSSSSSSSFLSAGKTYDQYGFLRVPLQTPIAQQLLFDAVHRTACDARAVKWKDYMAKNNHALPPRSEKTKRYVRKGIPHELRKRAWFYYSGAEYLCADEGLGLYAFLCCREEQDVRAGYTKEESEVVSHISAIDRDIYRTFPENIKFRPRQSSVPSSQFARPDSRVSFSSSSKSSFINEESSIHFEQNPYLLSLRRVLVAFAYYSTPVQPGAESRHAPVRAPSYPVGYCQSLNFVAAFLLLVFADDDFDFECGDGPARLLVEERVFWMLVVIIENLLPREFFGSTLEGARAAQVVLWTHLVGQHGARFGLEPLQRWLARENAAAVSTPSSSGGRKPSASASSTTLGLVTTGWFLTLFTTVLPPHALLRLWDAFVYQGEKVLFRFTLTLLALHQRRIIDATLADLSAWRIVKAMPGACYDVSPCAEMFSGKPRPRFSERGLSLTFNRRRFGREDAGGSAVVSSPVSPTEEIRWENADLGAFRKGVGTVGRKFLVKLREAALMEIRELESDK